MLNYIALEKEAESKFITTTIITDTTTLKIKRTSFYLLVLTDDIHVYIKILNKGYINLVVHHSKFIQI